MSHVTIYLDAETREQVRRAAQAEGISQSQWVANLIREHARTHWPASAAQLAGAWTDFPSQEELRGEQGEDLPREKL